MRRTPCGDSGTNTVGFFLYYETIKRELKIRPIYELLGGLKHLKIETRLINEKFANEMGEYVT